MGAPTDARDQLQALIWDMDGTLIDSGVVVPDAFIATVQAIGGISYTREQVIDLYPVGPPALLLTRLLGRSSTAADLAEYHQRLRATASTIQPYPEIASVSTLRPPGALVRSPSRQPGGACIRRAPRPGWSCDDRGNCWGC
jgi:beta-phosphoglucomutase-like phosphatase (HAD superfamily)